MLCMYGQPICYLRLPVWPQHGCSAAIAPQSPPPSHTLHFCPCPGPCPRSPGDKKFVCCSVHATCWCLADMYFWLQASKPKRPEPDSSPDRQDSMISLPGSPGTPACPTHHFFDSSQRQAPSSQQHAPSLEVSPTPSAAQLSSGDQQDLLARLSQLQQQWQVTLFAWVRCYSLHCHLSAHHQLVLRYHA